MLFYFSLGYFQGSTPTQKFHQWYQIKHWGHIDLLTFQLCASSNPFYILQCKHLNSRNNNCQSAEIGHSCIHRAGILQGSAFCLKAEHVFKRKSRKENDPKSGRKFTSAIVLGSCSSAFYFNAKLLLLGGFQELN